MPECQRQFAASGPDRLGSLPGGERVERSKVAVGHSTTAVELGAAPR